MNTAEKVLELFDKCVVSSIEYESAIMCGECLKERLPGDACHEVLLGEIRSALEKQVPKRMFWTQHNSTGYYVCGACKGYPPKNASFCPYCGQALDRKGCEL